MTIHSDHRVDFDVLRRRLEQEYERHARQLTDLSSTRDDDSDRWLKAELIDGSSRVLADIAGALRAMAEDRYGICVACGEGIPGERLRLRPEARYCVPCQRKHRG
jgi:DnaK suppressor protein